MPEKHIILLPKRDYWDWVKAVQNYVQAFNVNVTPDVNTAGKQRAPGQIVTVINPPDGYPAEGDIKAWFMKNYASAKLDVIDVSAPEELKKRLQERIDRADRYGERTGPEASPPFRLRWPTDYPKISQPFGANPEIYSRYGLPGHEGLDIRAPLNTNVYACADGEVYRVHDDPDTHPYGRHVRISHRDGYRTVYGHLLQSLVKEGQRVKAGEKIALADSTGNSTGSHLHLTLKKLGATQSGETHYPRDVMDPTPFMIFPGQEDQTVVRYTYPWPLGRCLVGLNARDDGSYADVDFEVVKQARLEAVKIGKNTSGQDIARLRQVNSALFLMGHLYIKLPQAKISAQEWVDQILPDMTRLYQLGVRYFEVHRSPNLQMEGWNTSWHSGGGFARWWLDVVNQVKDRFTDVRLGFPGVSPGGQVEGQRLDAKTFIEQADEAILKADWVGVNSFWSSEQEMSMEENGAFYQYMRELYPEKLLFITEYANVNSLTNPYVKGREYVEFHTRLRGEPGIGAAFANVMSSSSAYGNQRWRTEDGQITQIVTQVGEREF